ncbi:MAG: response regulator [Candidatus Aminicenantes bacterium]|nr:MAG: response regulator [Candidatus Aminicenantes bacterium]
MSVRILLVDDNRDTLRVYKKALTKKIKVNGSNYTLSPKEKTGMVEVEEADTISLALEKLKTQSYDILVVDLKIPGSDGDEMGGLEIISEALGLNPLLPIIAVTGYGSVALAKKTLTQGVFDFIEKSDTAVDDLILSVQKAIDSDSEKNIRAGNPFTPMSGLEPTVFGGRKEELEFFEQKLNRTLHTRFCEHFLVLGNWGIGKSTLLKEYKKICQSRGYLVSIVPLESFQNGTGLPEVARSIVEGILRALPYPIDKFKKVTNYFDSIGFSLLGTGLEFSRDTTKKEISPQAFLYDSLLNIWQDLKDKTEVLVILLDDLENLMSVPGIVMTLKQTLSMDLIAGKKILVGITSTPSCWLELTAVKKHHPLSRYFLSRVELKPLKENELKETILKSLMGTGVLFAPGIINRVFEYTRGHPFEMQVLCNHLFNNQLSRRVDHEVWDKALQTALRDMGVAVFDNWFRHASEEEAKVLRIIAKEDSFVSVQRIQDLAKARKIKIAPKSITKYLQRLLEKELIIKSSRGLYTIPDFMFRTYIRTFSD